MWVRSRNTAVTWAKPLRENERVYSRVGVPARIFSIWNVICFSISTGVSAGAMALICTWLLVTSGTASIGSLLSDQTPRAQAMAVNSTTNQRLRTERARIFAIVTRRRLGF